MMQLKLFNGVLKDKTGYPVASLIGDFDFLLKSYKGMIDNSTELPPELVKAIKDGRIEFVEAYVICVDDNDVTLNTCISVPCNLGLGVQALYDSGDIGEKQFVYDNRRIYSAVDKIYNKIEKECIKLYEQRKNEKFNAVKTANS